MTEYFVRIRLVSLKLMGFRKGFAMKIEFATLKHKLEMTKNKKYTIMRINVKPSHLGVEICVIYFECMCECV